MNRKEIIESARNFMKSKTTGGESPTDFTMSIALSAFDVATGKVIRDLREMADKVELAVQGMEEGAAMNVAADCAAAMQMPNLQSLIWACAEIDEVVQKAS